MEPVHQPVHGELLATRPDVLGDRRLAHVHRLLDDVELAQPVEAARVRVAAVIEAMPILRMHEVAKPRTLDASAEVLLAAGLVEEAAIALGRAEATELPVSTIFSRSARHDVAREEIIRRLGADETERLMADGAARSVDDALAEIHGWLRAG